MYEEIDQITIDILNRFGAKYSVARTSNTGAVTNLTLTGVQVEKVFEELPGSDIEIGDWKMLMTSEVLPKKGDLIALNDGRYTVMRVDEVAPAKVVVAYWIWVRRG